MSKNKIFLFFLVVLAVTTAYVVSHRLNNHQTITIKEGKIRDVVAASGEIAAEKKADLAFNKVGRISYLPFKENQEVKKGQVVASLDRSDLVAVKNKELKDYLDARWDWEQQRDDYNIEGDYQKTTLSDEQKRTYEKKQFSLDRSVIDVEIADRAIKNASLIAPFDGIVTQVNGEVNEWTSAFSSEPLVQIVDFSTLFFEADVDQKFAAEVKIGQKAIVKLDAYLDKEFTGAVYEKSNVVKKTEDGDKVLVAKIRLNNLPSDISLGLEGDAEIILEEKEALLIPKKAVEREDGKTYIRTKVGSFQYENKEVKLGIFDGTNYEVLDGIGKGEDVWFR